MFSDVSTHWAKDEVNDLGSRMVISGIGNDLFNPDADITRAEFAAIIVRGLGAIWAVSGIADSIQAGIVSGRDESTLAPKAYITRAEVAKLVQQLLRKSDLL